MESVLKNLYRGGLCPSTRDLAHSDTAHAYSKLQKSQQELTAQLEHALSGKDLDTFKAFCEIQMQIEVEEQEDLFLYAFRLGARFAQEIFSRDWIVLQKKTFKIFCHSARSEKPRKAQSEFDKCVGNNLCVVPHSFIEF